MEKKDAKKLEDLENLVYKLAFLITTTYKKTEKQNKKTFFRNLSKVFRTAFSKNKKLFQKLAYHLYLYSYESFAYKIRQYMFSVYFSKNYSYFKKMEPINVVRMVRYYLGKKGKNIPLNLTPFLLKEARCIKKNIQEQIRYRLKKNPLIPEEILFEEIKERKFKKKKRKNTRTNLV